MDPAEQPQALQALFRLFVLNCALRNGDAHQAALLELLRKERGAVLGTVSSMAAKLSLPPSTLSGALKALQDRGLIVREGRSILLADGEV